jgi:hypothetical protein
VGYSDLIIDIAEGGAPLRFVASDGGSFDPYNYP